MKDADKSMWIRMKHVTKQYEGQDGTHTVLKDLDMEIPHGKVSVLMGPSGSGKTTVARLLLGLEQPDEGTIEGVPERYSAVFQEDRLIEERSAISNIRAVTGALAAASAPAGRRTHREEIVSMLEALGLGGHEHEPVRVLSGGMRRRVALARALCAPSDLLILDEPFKGLDEEAKTNAAEVIKRASEGKTVLLITHDVKDAGLFQAEIMHLTPQEAPNTIEK